MKIIRLAIPLLVLIVASTGYANIFEKKFPPPTPMSDKAIDGAVLSPDGRTIVLSVGEQKTRHLYKVNIDGTDLTPLTTGETFDVTPVISPDGTNILYSHDGDVCVIKLDGSERRCITSGPEMDVCPVYTPDGSKIYFLRALVFRKYSPIAVPTWHEYDVYSINSDGTDLKQITAERYYSKRGLSINSKADTLMLVGAGESDKGEFGPSQIQIFPIDDPVNKKIIRPDLERYRERGAFGIAMKVDYSRLLHASLSPDGTRILFTWPLFEGLYVMDLKTSIVERIWKWEPKEPPFGGGRPSFSPDGRQILFSTATRVKESNYTSRTEPRLWIINTDGTGLRSIDIK